MRQQVLWKPNLTANLRFGQHEAIRRTAPSVPPQVLLVWQAEHVVSHGLNLGPPVCC